ncbi:hypothetical protein ACE41H_15545 [Paenibacillus enshidis]|uniref:DUF4375 domain-containing protein n=1 Tax=Paenibacillus enshidis TaxID=1458439 RepID=A0ABV5AYF3_9BACL
MLTEKETKLLEYMDYQVVNNSMDGWLGNRGYDRVFEFVEVLKKRNSELDQKVASIFIKATVSGLGYYQTKEAAFIPEYGEMFDEYEKDIEECTKEYLEVAKDFMESYGLEGYGTKISKYFMTE